MAEGSSRGGDRKRPFVEDVDSNKAPPEKRIRFPKGKKVRQGDYVVDAVSLGEEIIPGWKDPRLVAKDRSLRRNKVTAELLDEENDTLTDIKVVEVQYKEDEVLVEEGVPLDPFNLEKEREEGYFDENENYVEYVNKNEIKDAWLDSVDVVQKYSGKMPVLPDFDEKPRELTTEELAEINRRIANVLEPGETVLRALRRLKGSSNNKKQKMSDETKQLFDQLTEDAAKLMDNGDYNVYEEKQESFDREAGGYEKLVNTRKQGLAESMPMDDSFDIFGDDDGDAANPTSNGSGSVSVQPSESGDPQNDYVYDESSGYYYSSSSGYYYDPSSGYYCSAATGKWYLYNEASKTYDEVQQEANAAAASTT